jgi:hypothetical protein
MGHCQVPPKRVVEPHEGPEVGELGDDWDDWDGWMMRMG